MTRISNISPRARRLADENGLDLDALSLRGSGPHGRVMEADVQAFLDASSGDGPETPTSPTEEVIAAPSRTPDLYGFEADPDALALGLPGSRLRLRPSPKPPHRSDLDD